MWKYKVGDVLRPQDKVCTARYTVVAVNEDDGYVTLKHSDSLELAGSLGMPESAIDVLFEIVEMCLEKEQDNES